MSSFRWGSAPGPGSIRFNGVWGVPSHNSSLLTTLHTLSGRHRVWFRTSALDIHLTGNGNRLNETMRVLTVMSAFFIPLTFIVGVYGMNFAHMPELSWRYGYLVVWVVMLGVTAGLLAYFRRRRWM